jgi:16S rRNA (guanine(966)-N(2))-methyltransferase RsmD
MRVIAGTLKGRRLAAPTWEGLRPTSDKLRETLFNVLAARVPGARVVDGFAGTGAVGIEALSRGADHVAFVERDERAARLIEKNLAGCGVTEGYAIIRAPFERAAAIIRAQPPFAPFDLVLLDPPYASREGGADLERTLEQAAGLMGPQAVLVLEHARTRETPASVGPLARTRVIASGDSALSLYQLT